MSTIQAWAVGVTGTGHSLILHWDGKKWGQAASPTVGRNNILEGVTAVSAKPKNTSSAWAVARWLAVCSASPAQQDR